ncbi:DUF4377 domain-containing protein [Lacinutrix sp. Hel_I_90]|uniref:DUF4377 domain-containing protein n=1 Tax=Lacinutrix sp. Hel_I_90 TaxID=1249999 RepID=UPI0005CA9866|nr:DUF4377 domain-containing protein [Lacinutrix sp. Hel_I_90]
MKKIIHLLFISIVLSSCSKDDDSLNTMEVLWVDSQYSTCINFLGEEYPCLSIQSNAIIVENAWTYHHGIEGFDYQEGFIYRILIKREKLKDEYIDGPSYRSYLIKVLSKEEI